MSTRRFYSRWHAWIAAATSIAVSSQLVAQSTIPSIIGVTFDSLHVRPLAGAMVAIEGTGRSTLSDANGRFRFDSVSAGTYRLTVQHDAFDAIGLNGASRGVRVDRDDVQVTLALPSFATLWSRLCGSPVPARDTMLVFGSVRLAEGDTISRASLVGAGEWVELSGKGTSLADIGQRRFRREASVDSIGSYALCGLPVGIPLTLVFAASPTDSLRRVQVTLASASERVIRQDVTLPAGSMGRAARGVLTGVVRNANGAGIAGASVMVGEFDTVRTDEGGQFVVRDIPEGTHQLRIIAIGFQGVSQPVVIDARRSVAVELSLTSVTRLEAIKVESTILSERTRSIEARMKMGFGYHRDSSVMRDFPGVVESLNSVPGVRVLRRGTQVQIVSNGGCSRWDVRLDGRPVDVEDLRILDPREIAMMEVYPRPSTVPSELMSRRGCPLLVWTKRGLGRQP